MSLKLSREWVERAEEDYQAALALSKKRKPSFLNSVCFHSQQAMETGDFELVTDLAITLNPYAVEFRYPGERATRADVKRTLGACREIREFIRRKLQPPKR